MLSLVGVGVTPSPPPSPRPERASLSRDLSDFLIELSIALHKHSIYPGSHPSLAPAALTVTRRAELLLQDRQTLSLGVARQQLVIEGVATDPKHPVLRELAERLHRHHLGAITISREVGVEEMRDALATLAIEADRTGAPLGLGPAEGLRRWAHIRLHPLTYERLELVDETPADASGTPEQGASRARGAQLWIGLARAALAAESSDETPASTEPAVIAKAIDERAPASAMAYDQAIVGYLLQIAEELKVAGAAEAVPLRRRMSRLIRNLKPETLRRLLDMGGDFAQRSKFVADAAEGMAVDAVIEIVQAAAETSHQNVSHALVRLLSKFAAHAERGTETMRPQADAALRDQVRKMLQGWNLADPNPAAYGGALQRMAQSAPVHAVPAAPVYAPEPDRIAAMALELDVTSDLVFRSVERLITEGRIPQLLDALEQTKDEASARRIAERIDTPVVVERLCTANPPDWKALERLAPRVGTAAVAPLVDGLARAENRGARRGFLSILVQLGPGIAPLIAERLTHDVPWYVTRNLLTLLDELHQPPPGPLLERFTSHADARVRLTALKLELQDSSRRERAIRVALADADERVIRLGLGAAQDKCPDSVVPLLAERVAAGAGGWGDDPAARLAAIRALGAARAPLARETLLAVADGGRTLFGRKKLPPRSPELLAALSVLASRWRDNPNVQRVLDLAAAASDPEIRAAAGVTVARRKPTR
ncbi:MAG TPA: hypothetical protein VLV45_00085 [Gemmatimonadales bacterium]|nr:hypothetical protein [Gemmatimonadales bacterium]